MVSDTKHIFLKVWVFLGMKLFLALRLKDVIKNSSNDGDTNYLKKRVA